MQEGNEQSPERKEPVGNVFNWDRKEWRDLVGVLIWGFAALGVLTTIIAAVLLIVVIGLRSQ